MRTRILSLLTLIALLVVPVGLFLNRQAIFDWYRLRNYSPPAEIAQLAETTTMTDEAKRLFYVFYPELQDKEAFNASCRNIELSIVLGCYVQGQGIYIFRVVDPRLDGIEEVTAAHEMLHVAYERLSRSERERVDTLTREAFDLVTNERIIRTLDSYRERDAGVVPNELHSIIASEVRDIPEELEAYYAKYFTDRTAVVSLSEQYEKAFTERKDRVEAFDRQLEALRGQIDSAQSSLDRLQGSLNSERSRLDALLAEGRNQEYNAAVPGFNNLVRSYNNTVAGTQRLIDEFNRIVVARNELVVEERQLIEAIDSRPTTIEMQ